MKKIAFYLFLITVQLIVNIAEVEGQNSTDFKIQRKVSLSPESNQTEIKVLCKNGLNHFRIAIDAKVYKGKLKIEIFNPKGTKIDYFDIESHLTNIEKSRSLEAWEANAVTGQINKTIREPIQGNWLIKIIPDKVFGEIVIESLSSYN